jgi:hypothetical protein
MTKLDMLRAQREAKFDAPPVSRNASRNTPSRNTVTEYPVLVTAQRKRGRPPIGDHVMTAAERQRRKRAAERVLNETRMAGKKLAKERLEEFMELFCA